MLKFNKTLLLVALLAFVLVAMPASAQVKVATMGAPLSSGLYPIVMDSDGFVTYNGGIYSKYELATTSDTLTTIESGKIIVVKQDTDITTDTVTFVLPSTAVGLRYTFISADDETIYLDPAIADVIRYGGTVPMDAGDKLASPGATGDSVSLICAISGTWDVLEYSGNWSDAGTTGE